MASMPPPYNPNDPNDPNNPRNAYRYQREYWRAQRDQQRAAWRAQRDAWRAQRSYYGACRRPSIIGPIFLIAIGIVSLLLMTGNLNGEVFWRWYSHWWPLLLIGAGLALMVEWFFDRKSPYPFLRSGGVFGVLVLLAIVGGVASLIHSHGTDFQNWNFSDNDDDWFGSGAEHDHDDLYSVSIPANAAVTIQNPRGDISVAAADTNQMSVSTHEVVRTDDNGEAERIYSTLKPKVTVTGSSVLIRVDSSDRGAANLLLTLPAGVTVDATAQHGDVTISGVRGAVNVTSNHGDVKCDALGGSARIRLTKGDFSAHAIAGELDLNGSGNDVTISDVGGKVQVDGDYFGDTHFEHVGGTAHFHSSRSDVLVTQLPGEIDLSDKELHVTSAFGPVRINTRSKDIELGQVAGEIHIENSHGSVEVTPGNPMGVVEITNRDGDVKLALPEATGFALDTHVHNGDLTNEFNLNLMSSGSDDKSVTGQVGKGGPRISVNVTHGDLSLNRTARSLPLLAPPAPPAPPQPAKPGKPGKALRLTAPNGTKVQTVVQ